LATADRGNLNHASSKEPFCSGAMATTLAAEFRESTPSQDAGRPTDTVTPIRGPGIAESIELR